MCSRNEIIAFKPEGAQLLHMHRARALMFIQTSLLFLEQSSKEPYCLRVTAVLHEHRKGLSNASEGQHAVSLTLQVDCARYRAVPVLHAGWLLLVLLLLLLLDLLRLPSEVLAEEHDVAEVLVISALQHCPVLQPDGWGVAVQRLSTGRAPRCNC